jgi:hypothetical protein
MKSNLPSKTVDVLLGPLVDWAMWHDKIEVPREVREMARQMCEPGCFYHVIALRMCFLYSLCGLEVDPAFTLPYYIGVAMDIHIPALRLGKALTLHQVYTQKVAPELVLIDGIEHDCFSQIEESVLERHWVSYSCHTEPTAKKNLGRGARSKKARKSIPRHTLIREGRRKPVRHQRQDPNSLSEMLTKGLPNPSVFRYVPKTLEKGLVQAPDSNPVIVRMARMHLLGTYHHAMVIAPPAFRLKVTEMTPEEMMQLIRSAKFNTKQLYSILSEFISSCTEHNQALWAVLQEDHVFDRYVNNAYRGGDSMRAHFYGAKRPIERPCKPPTEVRVPTSIRLFWEIAKHLQIKIKCILPRDIELACTGSTTRQLYGAFERQPNSLRIYRKILEDIAFPPEDLEILDTLFSKSNVAIMKSLKKILITISDVGRAKLKIYLHYIKSRSMLAIVPIGHSKRLPATDQKPCILVCFSCFTIRTQCLIEVPKKSTKSVIETDIIGDEPRCSTCHSTRIYAVDTRKNYVYGPSMSDDTQSRMYCTCARCGIATVYQHVIGQTELCRDCYYGTMASLLVVRKCICGAKIDEKTNAKAINALNENGKVGVYGLCQKHIHLSKSCRSSDIKEIGFYKTLIRLCDRKRSIQP